MEYRNTTHNKLFGLNLLACIAVIAVAVALLGMAYFNYQAKVKEAQALSEMSKGFIGIMKMGEQSNAEAQRNIEKLEREQKERESLERQQSMPPTSPSPTPPASDPPDQLPAYNSPQTPAPYPTR